MLSRVADSLYWMNRYVERAENVARFLDVNYNLTLGEGGGLGHQWSPLVNTTGDHERFIELYGESNRANVVQFLAFDDRNPNSIISCITSARENARSVRETITTDMWEQVNKFYLLVRAAARAHKSGDNANAFCLAVKLASHTLVGITYTTMSHGEAWHFLRMGRLIERADKTSRIVDVQYYLLLPTLDDVGGSLDVVRWSALLRSTSALTMYRRVHGQIRPERVAEFLILDRDFPRAMRFCVLGAQNSLQHITGTAAGTFRRRSEQLLGRFRAVLDYTSIADVIQRGMHEYIDDFQTKLNEIDDAIQTDFFKQGGMNESGQRQSQI
ncbi:MAG: alpha-E domain-containing protein [Pirellulales bacterium]|nr:alpha-E domain-containing protein [Pirellulales bacterium]MBX3435169.1 alpha-E domain-containing protein [Pirellulales bacterium]